MTRPGGGQVSYNEELSSYVTIDNTSAVQAMYLTTTETFSSNGYLLNIPDVEQHLFSLESESTSYSLINSTIMYNNQDRFFWKTFTSTSDNNTHRLSYVNNSQSTVTSINSNSQLRENVQYSDFYTDIVSIMDRIKTSYTNGYFMVDCPPTYVVLPTSTYTMDITYFDTNVNLYKVSRISVSTRCPATPEGNRITGSITFTDTNIGTYLNGDWDIFQSWQSAETGYNNGSIQLKWIERTPSGYELDTRGNYLIYNSSFFDMYKKFKSSSTLFTNSTTNTTYRTTVNQTYNYSTFNTTTTCTIPTESIPTREYQYFTVNNNTLSSDKLANICLNAGQRIALEQHIEFNSTILENMRNNIYDGIECEIRPSNNYYIPLRYTYTSTSYHTTTSNPNSTKTCIVSIFDDDNNFIDYSRYTTTESVYTNISNSVSSSIRYYSYDNSGRNVVDENGNMKRIYYTFIEYLQRFGEKFVSDYSIYATSTNTYYRSHSSRSSQWAAKVTQKFTTYNGSYMNVNTLEDMMYIPSYIGTRTITTGFANYVRLT